MNRAMICALALGTAIAGAVFADQPAGGRLFPRGGIGGNPQDPWWNEEHIGWVGSAIGGTLGVLGGAVGTLAGLRRARTFVLTSSLILAVLGVVFLGGGVVAYLDGQPYHVYFPLLLSGAVATLVFGVNYPGMKRVYDGRDAQSHFKQE